MRIKTTITIIIIILKYSEARVKCYNCDLCNVISDGDRLKCNYEANYCAAFYIKMAVDDSVGEGITRLCLHTVDDNPDKMDWKHLQNELCTSFKNQTDFVVKACKLKVCQDFLCNNFDTEEMRTSTSIMSSTFKIYLNVLLIFFTSVILCNNFN